MDDLASKNCLACEAGTPPFTKEEAEKYFGEISDWELVDDAGKLKIRKRFKFGTYMEGIDFVNGVAKIAESEDHHPDMFAGFKKVTVNLTTHVAGGLTENDFIMAAKIDKLLREF